jgi:uncharacterized alpha-E superfamily protein
MLSRVADSLYWMSRYLERAEHMARVTDVCLNRMLEMRGSSAEDVWTRLTASLRVTVPTDPGDNITSRIQSLIFAASTGSLAHSLGVARDNARQVREQISSEMWEQLNELFLYMKSRSADRGWEARPHEFFESIIEGSQLCQGITDSTMSHGEGWHAIQAGRFIERAVAVAALLDVHYRTFMPANVDRIESEDYADWVCLLKSCTAFEAYCKVYTANLRPYLVAEFLLLNEEFPHSIRFAIERVGESVQAIAGMARIPLPEPANRRVGRLRAQLSFAQVDEIIGEGLSGYVKAIEAHCAGIHLAFNQTFISYAADSSRWRSAG